MTNPPHSLFQAEDDEIGTLKYNGQAWEGASDDIGFDAHPDGWPGRLNAPDGIGERLHGEYITTPKGTEP